MFPSVAPAHLIGTVGVVLHRHLCPAAELRKLRRQTRRPWRSGGVLTTTPPLSTGASLVSASPVVGMAGMAVVTGEHHAGPASSARWSAAEEAQHLRDGRQRLRQEYGGRPCLVSDPISSLSNTHSTGTMSPLRRQKALGAGKHRPGRPAGGRHELASAPRRSPGWLYCTRSPATTSSGAQSAVLGHLPIEAAAAGSRRRTRPPDHGPGRT